MMEIGELSSPASAAEFWTELRRISFERLKEMEAKPVDYECLMRLSNATLKDPSLAARVLPPQGADDGYRVVLGPYATRAQAEATGRRLGRPFWIYQPNQ